MGICINEKEYLFNPFRIKEVSNNQLQKMYEETYKKLLQEPNTMYEYAHNIEIYSNLMYICGECIARFTREIIELKNKIQIDTAVNQVQERNNWNVEKNGKAPAISYFEALATRMSREDINRLADKECFLKRFKNAYDSLEVKTNALKKKLESIKYEEFN
ncbi:MAG: hypothetical protein II625_06175 [Bacilli bacterium]|nr:hypothetical protein [Bacilli bacterium]